MDQHQQMMDKFLAERQHEADDLKMQHEKDIADCRKTLSAEYEAKIQEVETHYSEEIEKLKLDLQVMLEQKETAQGHRVKVIPDVMEISPELVSMETSEVTGHKETDVTSLEEDSGPSDIDNSLLGVKGSHAAAIAEIEAEYEKKLQELRDGRCFAMAGVLIYTV